ncbi:MAG: hypothetical protein PHQ75_13295 [Thermoguttaceae bacterium]|nr:hypothetical protein [Thermoguttaceae bacterium]
MGREKNICRAHPAASGGRVSSRAVLPPFPAAFTGKNRRSAVILAQNEAFAVPYLREANKKIKIFPKILRKIILYSRIKKGCFSHSLSKNKGLTQLGITVPHGF